MTCLGGRLRGHDGELGLPMSQMIRWSVLVDIICHPLPLVRI